MRPLPIAAAALALAASARALAETVVVTADRMVDVATGRYVQNPAVVITDGRITAVGRQGATAVPADARTVALPGMTLLPGLIDMHVHLDSSPIYGGYTGLRFSDRFWSVLAVANARKTLDAGFTTVRNLGSDAWNDIGLRQAIEEGHVPGPRVVGAGYSIGATGGHCDSTYFPPSMEEANPYRFDGPESARRSVREVRKYGAQVIKICATGGVFSRNTEPGQQQLSLEDQQQLSLEEMKAVVDDAHMLGLEVAAHAHGASGIKDAIRAGVDTVEHASFIDDEGIALAKANDAWLSMDIYNTEYTLAEGAKNGVLPENIEKERQVGTLQRENFAKAHRAGAGIVFGTDAGVYPHGDNARQFAVMVRYGMTPAEAIRAATADAAKALGAQGRDVGAVAVGRWGDLIAVRGDPLADVAALESVPVVIKAGTVVKDAR